MIKVEWCKAAYIGGDVRFGATETAEADEIAGPERVGLEGLHSHGALPRFTRVGPEVRPARTLVARTRAISPVITVGKTAARPPDYRRVNAAHGVYESSPDPVRIRNARSLTYPDAVIDDAAEVFGKVSIDVGGNRSDWLVQQNLNAGICCCAQKRLAGEESGRGNS